MKHIWIPSFFKLSPNDDGGGGGGGGNQPDTSQDPNADQIKAKEAKIQELEQALAAAKKTETTLSSKVSALSADIEKIRTQGLKSKEDYKTLSESLEQQVNTLQGENTKLKDSIFHTTRVSAVKDAAVKLGLRSAALSDIEAMDLDDVKVTVGEDKIIRSEGASEFANRLKTLKPYLFETPKDPQFNGGGGGGGGGGGATITQADINEAFAKRNRGPSERKAYNELVKRFDEQTRKAKAK